MSEPWEKSAHSGALWRRWKMIETGSNALLDEQVDMPDELTLAAYVEGRLEASERAVIDAILAVRPDLAEDIALARRLVDDAEDAATSDIAPEFAAVIARASALVPASGDRVIAFRPRRGATPVWHAAVRWSALAASFVLACYLGFALGTDASSNLASLTPGASVGLADEMLDPPTGFLGPTGDASST